MHGDDLAVFGIAFSLGVPFVWDAVKERGWRRYAAASVGALFILFAAAWPWTKGDLPKFASAVTAFATDRETWWFLILIGLATFWLTGRVARPTEIESDPEESLKALGFRDLNHLKDWLSEEPLKQIRTLNEKIQVFGNPSATTDTSLRSYQGLRWTTPGTALDEFCESRERWGKAWERRDKLRENTRKAKENVNKLVYCEQYEGIERERSRANVKHSEAIEDESEYDKIFEDTENDILGELRELFGDGELIAKGFLSPLKSTSTEKLIPKDQWQALYFELGDAPYQTVKGGDVEYTGVRVAKAPPINPPTSPLPFPAPQGSPERT